MTAIQKAEAPDGQKKTASTETQLTSPNAVTQENKKNGSAQASGAKSASVKLQKEKLPEPVEKSPTDVAQRIRQLKSLYEDGILSKTEFEKKKGQLLDQM